MKTTEKDILMICKGYYNSGKYNSIEEALDGYYRKHYNISKERLPELSHEFMLSLWFNDCVRTFLQPDTITSFWKQVIVLPAFEEKDFINVNGCTYFYDVLFYRIVTWLALLDVRDKDGNWKIDLSDYEGLDYII